MTDKKDKVEDFADLWNKQKDSGDNKSVIGDFLNRIEQLEKENIKLRETIKQDIQLIAKTEEIVKQAIRDKQNLEKGIQEKDVALKRKNQELSMLKVESSAPAVPPPAQTEALESELKVNLSLIDDLQAQLEKKKAQIKDFQNMILNNESRIEELEKVNDSLTGQLLEKQIAKSSGGSSPLESLVQDLQSEINRYKKTQARLKEENKDLRKSLENGGGALESEIIKTLRLENKTLNEQIDLLTSKKAKKELLKEYQEKLHEKDLVIEKLLKMTESREVEPTQEDTTAVSGLVDELQNRINKLKITLKEKDELIKSLRGY